MSGKILVLGATGTIGKSLVAALVAKGESVKAASRGGQAVGGAEGVAFDYGNPATFAAALDGVDRAFVLAPTGTEDVIAALKPIIAAAAERKVKVVLMTAWGVDAVDEIPYRQVELFLIKSGTPYVILRPNWFQDNFLTFWGHGVQAGAIAVPAGDGQSAFIDTRDIADVAAAVLTTSAHDGAAYPLSGPRAIGYAEAAALISTAIGRPVAYQASTDEAFIAMLTGAGVTPGYAAFLASIFYPVREGWTAATTNYVALLTGHKPRTLEAWIAEHAAALKG